MPKSNDFSTLIYFQSASLYSLAMQDPFSLPSFAKINWILRILGRREDGFHELCTVFQTISLHDTIAFEASDKLELSCDDGNVPIDGHNIILRAAAALETHFGKRVTGRVHLTKRIPSPGGLGGGSSNAAVALKGFIKLCGLGPIPERDLLLIAEDLGADVPFFLNGGTALGIGRGDVVSPLLREIGSENLLVVTPNVNVATARAFALLNASTLTSDDQKHNLTVCRNQADLLDLFSSELKNDFEASVFDAYPEVKRVKDTLLELGAVNAAMSGSGASVFAIFDKTETRQAAIKALDHESTWRKFAVATISGSQYREALRC